MSILEIYKEKNQNQDWFDDHFSLADGSHGRLFEYTNTNFRKQDAFMTHFTSFLDIESRPRIDWPRQVNHGQEIHKHMVMNMMQSKLFKKDVNDLYSKTAKGILYADFINSSILGQEKWLINYLFLLNGYYLNRKNYIVHRVKGDIVPFLMATDGITLNLLVKEAKALLASEPEDIYDSLRKDFFYIHSFYNDQDFLIAYLRSSSEEKEELANYIEHNLKNRESNCCISRKYKSGGNFTRAMLFDETKVFFVTLLFTQTRDINSDNIYKKFVDIYSDAIDSLNKKTVLDYLYKNKDIFDSIFEDILELEDVQSGVFDDDVTEIVQLSKIDTEDVPEDYIDETSETGRQKIKAVFALKKKQARLLSNFTCALENMNHCKPVYFTAKVSNRTYLELHHFIPQEFRNDFPHSIEVLANYVTLCPRCHRQIHLAVDRERKHLITSLYNERIERLKLVGLPLKIENIYEYYKIDSV